MTIATPMITDFDKEDIAPWAGNRLIDLHMATLPSKPFARFFPWNKNALNLGYQKLRPRYEPMDEITQAVCEPLCQEGWYFDCDTETCKEYSHYSAVTTYEKSVLLSYEVTIVFAGGGYTTSVHNCEITCPYKISSMFKLLEDPTTVAKAVFGGESFIVNEKLVEVESGCNLPSNSVYLNSGTGDLLYDGEANITTTVSVPVYSGQCEYLGPNVGLIKVKNYYNLKVYGVK